MKISTYSHNNSEIDVLEINGELTARGAVRLEKYLYSSMDEGRILKVINLKHLKKADGLGLSVLEHFINRGMRIRLFNAGLEILNLLNISGKEGIIRLYNCQEPDEAVLLFEKEFLKESESIKGGVKRRRFLRVNTSLHTEFKSTSSHNGEISYKAFIENLSEGGFLINQISAFNKKTEERVNAFEMVGKNFSDIKFSLDGGSRLIKPIVATIS